MSAVRQASRVDRETGIREIAEFFGAGPEKMFGFTHLPAGPAEVGVVICSPLYAEFVRNYRREVLIGRRLASLGIAVQRFHYRGYGNSDGDLGGMTLDSMLTDAREAVARLEEVSGIGRLALFGTRVGCLAAAAVAREHPGAPVVLWDPVAGTSQYFRDIFRAGRIQELKQGSREEGTNADMLELLKRNGAFHILGYTITRSLYLSGQTYDLVLGASRRSVLVIHMGPRADRALAGAVAGWCDAGLDVATYNSGRTEPWWFTAGALVGQEALTEPVEITVDWLMRVLP